MVGDQFNIDLKDIGSTEDQPGRHHAGEARSSVRPEQVARARRLLQQADYPNAEVIAAVAAELVEILRRRGSRVSF
jgi:hypothetical protein